MSKSFTKNRLNGKDYKSFLENLRASTSGRKDIQSLVAKLVHDRNWYFEKFHEKEIELKNLVQQELFENRQREETVKKNSPPPPKPPPMERGERIWKMFQLGAREVDRMLLFTKSTREQLAREANVWAITHGKDQVS